MSVTYCAECGDGLARATRIQQAGPICGGCARSLLDRIAELEEALHELDGCIQPERERDSWREKTGLVAKTCGKAFIRVIELEEALVDAVGSCDPSDETLRLAQEIWDRGKRRRKEEVEP